VLANCAILAMALAAAPDNEVTRANSYDTVIFGLQPGLFGGRSGAGPDNSVVWGFSWFVGWRCTEWRVGAQGKVLHSTSFGPAGWAGDVGAFLSYDIFSLWLDNEVSLAAFARVDLLGRIRPWFGGAGFGSLGLRVFGIELSWAAGAEVAPGLPSPAWGFAYETRIAVDLLELGRTIGHFKGLR
jgi:hypothetical protein